MLLYVPFRDFHALTDIGQALDPNARPERYDINRPRGEIDRNWTLVFRLTIHSQPALFPHHVVQAFHDINQDDFDITIDPDDDDPDPPEPPRRREQEWERLAREVPAGRGNIGRPRQFLGERDVDLLHDWNTDLPREHLSAVPETFVALQRQEAARNVAGQEHITPETLNPGQRTAFDHIIDGFRQRISAYQPGDPQNIIVVGSAGVGKSFLIRAIESTVWELAKERFGEEQYPDVRTAIKLVAFTGKAAFQVGGVTIHSLLSIGVRGLANTEELSNERLRKLQNNLKGTHFLFIDEMSMVGLRMLHQIDQRLRQAFPQHRDQPFGGLTVVMFGDFAQLPPVGDPALYHVPTENNPPFVHQGSKLYRETFTKVFRLEQQMRQQGQGEDDMRFATVLAHLRVGEVTMEDWMFMQTRVLAHLPDEERDRFKDALFLFQTNDKVRERNLRTLESLHVPVARIVAKYQDIREEEGAKVDDDDAGGLPHELLLCVGARV